MPRAATAHWRPRNHKVLRLLEYAKMPLDFRIVDGTAEMSETQFQTLKWGLVALATCTALLAIGFMESVI